MTPIKAKIVRRCGGLVLRIGPRGVSIRGYRRRKWRFYSWEQILSLETGESLIKAAEIEAGRKLREKLSITWTMREAKKQIQGAKSNDAPHPND